LAIRSQTWRPVPFRIFDPDAAVVGFDDSPRDGQSHAGADTRRSDTSPSRIARKNFFEDAIRESQGECPGPDLRR
jgi:hypothetical protein